ncbi:MAG: acetylxylan esterase [Candidatus Hydrogenedentes bacterium]|nr:acetylxylan esterase [Candidatus Hydrogenedentota bacterium]
MKRREFLLSSAVAGTAATLPASAPAAESTLPDNQWKPLPDLGTHWELLEKLSARCVPSMSFLNTAYTDPATWVEEARAALRECFQFPSTPEDLAPEVLASVDCGDFTREYVRIRGTVGIPVPLYLLVPKGLSAPAPALVALHDHGGFYFWGKEKLVRVDPVHPELRHYTDTYYGGRYIAEELARRGYVVAVPDMLHWGERGMYFEADPDRIKQRTLDVTEEDIKQFNARSSAHEEMLGRSILVAGTTESGVIAGDDCRAADYLCSRPEVDADRVGCLGLSVGSVRSIFLGALHPKVRASVAVCWMAEYQQMMRNNVRWAIGFTKLVPGLYNKLDWPDLGGLHYPGALMTINGLKDELYPLQAAQDAVAKLEKIYAKMGVPEKYEGVFFDGPHEFNLEMQERAFAWLDEQLKG